MTTLLYAIGADWLACVLRHFSKVKTVDIVVKGLSRRYIKAILKTCEAFETVTTVVVDNDELIKWTSYGKTLRTVSIKPRQVSVWNTALFYYQLLTF